MNLALCVVVAAATEITSNTAICTLMMPIMAQIVRKQEYDKAINSGFVLWHSVFLVSNAIYKWYELHVKSDIYYLIFDTNETYKKYTWRSSCIILMRTFNLNTTIKTFISSRVI
jgi:hypothetical protein